MDIGFIINGKEVFRTNEDVFRYQVSDEITVLTKAGVATAATKYKITKIEYRIDAQSIGVLDVPETVPEGEAFYLIKLEKIKK